jgi:hypothetical protein
MGQTIEECRKNWKSKLAYHFKKENLVFDDITSLNYGYTIKEFI